ncbi:MAG: acyl-CoA desaturase [Gemmatimonadota bacterium]
MRDGKAFHAELKGEVDAYFAERGLSQKGGAAMMVKTAILLLVTFVPYGLILTQAFPPVVMFLLAAMVGIGVAGIGFAVAHDAIHGSYSDDNRVNAVIGSSMDLVGGSSYMWKITHNVIHHTYTNIHGTDEDLAVSPLLRLSPHAPRMWFQRFQHWYAFVLYGMTTMFWVFVKDFKYLMAKDLGPYENKKHAFKDVAGLFTGKAIYYTWSLVIPFLVLDYAWWQIALGILTAHAVAGVTLGIVFQLAHVVEQTAHPEPDDSMAMPQSWVVHELDTTANFAPTNALLSWYVGGLNFQVEHHLFPKICSRHYPALSLIVARLAAKHGLPYHVQPTFRSAVASHLRTLKAYGAGRTVTVPIQQEALASA